MSRKNDFNKDTVYKEFSLKKNYYDWIVLLMLLVYFDQLI